jgi:xanthine dehydrogenase molybdopterin-binding subunit B
LVENNRLYALWDKLIESSNYKHRRNEIDTFNSENEFYKKGLALTPVKFGISFTTAFLNQAGALVLIYKDGSVLINHGGTEMGQGLNTKIINIAAKELGISNEKIKVNATNTAKVPNTSATAASAGTDLNGFAVKNAIDIIKERMTVFLSNEYFDCEPKEIIFENNFVYQSNNFENKIDFRDAAMKAYMGQVGLSSTGFYKTPDVHFDREKGQGKPYHYFAYGMSVTEVLLDTLNGHHKMSRVDIVHDVGDSINARIDKGQVEGGFIQGVGWCTTEECKWDDGGNLLNHSPDTYKIPNVQDMPKDFRVELLENVPNDNTIRKSKAVGEPPLMLCFSAWLAIKDAISAVGKHQVEPDFSLPATNEIILLSLDKLRTNK